MKRRTENIYLIGFMGSGKTTLAKKIADLLHWEPLDIDALIEANLDCSITKIFNVYGEGHFRNYEREVLSQLANLEQKVVATGGGLPCYSNNMDLINNMGISIFLNVHYDVLLDRLIHHRSDRPLIAALSNEKLKSFIYNKMAERIPFYEKAQYVVSSEDQLISLIHSKFKV